MRIAVLGTGMVGQTLSTALAEAGHDVVLGTRDPGATRSREGWEVDLPLATYAEAAEPAEVVVTAVSGMVALDVLGSCGQLAGKIVLDVSNPLDTSKGFPPTLSVANEDSLAEQLQRAFPDARVVKALNTTNARVMVAPGELGGGDHTMFVAGDDGPARAVVLGLLEGFGWRDVIEFESLEAARGLEMWLPMWIRLMLRLGHANFNLKIVRD